MTKPKDPSDESAKPGEPSQDDPPVAKPLDLLIETIATVAGKMRGLDGAELKKSVANAVAQANSVVKLAAEKMESDATRQAAVAEVERMLESFAKTTQGVAEAIGPHRDAIIALFRSVNIDKIAEGLRVIASYMKQPSPETEASARKLMNELQAAMGPSASTVEPTDDEEARREQIRDDLKARLDKIFKTPTDKKLN